MDTLIEFMCNLAGVLFAAPLTMAQSIGDIAAGATSATISGAGTPEGASALIAKINTLLATGTGLFMPTLQSLGYALVVTFFIIQMIELIVSERCTLELLIKSFAKVGIGLGLVGYSEKIYKGLLEFADSFTTFVNNKASFNITASDSIGDIAYTLEQSFLDACKDYELAWLPIIGLALIIAPLLSLVMAALTAVVYVICIVRIIELNVRGCLLPLGFALMADDGWRGAGGRYIRKFLSIAAQGSVLCLIGKITSGCIGLAIAEFSTTIGSSLEAAVTLGDIVSSMLGGIAIIFGVSVAAIAAMFKSQAIISDAFGA